MTTIKFGIPNKTLKYGTPHDYLNMAYISVYINAKFVDTPILESAVPHLDPLSDVDYNDDDVQSVLDWTPSGMFRHTDRPAVFSFGSPVTDSEEVNVRITPSKLVDIFYRGSSFHIPSIFDMLEMYEYIKRYLIEISSIYAQLSEAHRAIVDQFAEFMGVLALEGIAKTISLADEPERRRVLEFFPNTLRLLNAQVYGGLLQKAVSGERPRTYWAILAELPQEFVAVRRSMTKPDPMQDQGQLLGSNWSSHGGY